MLVVTFLLTCIFNTFLYIWLKSHLVCDECCPWIRTLLGRCLGRSFCALSEPKAWGTEKSQSPTKVVKEEMNHMLRHLRSWWSGVGKWSLITKTGFMGQRRNLLPLTGHHQMTISALHENLMEWCISIWEKWNLHTVCTVDVTSCIQVITIDENSS